MKKTGVIGWPIAHSRSPIIHNYWLQQHGIDSLYEKHPVTPENLAAFMARLPTSELLGCNVTIPHKEKVFHYADVVDDKVRRLEAANTLYLRQGKIHATNTDGEGFLASLKQTHPQYELAGCKAVVLGAGGAARAIIDALLTENVMEVAVINRSVDRIAALREIFGAKVVAVEPARQQFALETAGLLVNTTSLGMENQPPLTLNVGQLQPHCLVADIVYTPLQTDLLTRAEARGLPILRGLGMLLHQAVRGFELWYGVRPQVTAELTSLVEADVLKGQTA